MRFIKNGLFRLVSIAEAINQACVSNFRDFRPFVRIFASKHARKTVDLTDSKEYALQTIRTQLKKDTFYPFHFNDAIQYLKAQSNSIKTSPGIKFRELGYKTKYDVLYSDKGVKTIHSMLHAVKNKAKRYFPYVFACVVKAKEIAGKIKARFAFVMPIQVLVAEAMFIGPILTRLPDDWVPKPETHHTRFCGQKSKSFDFTKFDASVPAWLIHEGLDIIWSLVNPSQYQGYGIPTGLSELFDYIRDVYTKTNVVLPDNTRMVLSDGIPSGGLCTNLLDTIISRIVLHHLHLPSCPSRVIDPDGTFYISTYGDDCHSKNCNCPDDVLVDRARSIFGMTLKIEHPNELGCLTYCKAECIRGTPFHSGQWYRDALCTADPDLRSLVAHCLTYSSPTRDQKTELEIIASEGFKPFLLGISRVKQKLYDMRTYLSRGRSNDPTDL
uniref:RNA-dependent RNA polymerase n=1 Tax=Osugoroshi virus 3 TaxID=2202813 RepID=A0A679BBS0_9VIRU|nr:RNA-dependent RNA polymerase [Osugoroshi virus 3]